VVKKQIDRLRELIDAGVFIFTGGAARTKTRDTDPLLQFKLSYRKIYGLTNFIGLSDRDRFELTDDLEEWLEHPENGKEILMRNLCGSDDDTASNNNEFTPRKRKKSIQTTFPVYKKSIDREDVLNPSTLPIKIKRLSLDRLEEARISAIVVGLGFEKRTLQSNSLLASHSDPEHVYAVRYQDPGYSSEIEQEWKKPKKQLEIIEYEKLFTGSPDFGTSTLIDITGLAKPYIFHTIRTQLIKHKRVYIFHVGAQIHYPTHDDLKHLIEAAKGDDPYRIMERLSEVLKGEEGPYKAINLLPSGSDESRKRSLIAFTSPKHERIFSLLENREYDQIEVVCPSSDKPRSKVAKMAGEIIHWDYPHTNLSYSDTDDLIKLIRHCDDLYLKQYSLGGANCEIGLTGSKIQAVAAAVLSSRRKISQAWYLKPKTFDSKRFSKGMGEVRCYEIQLQL